MIIRINVNLQFKLMQFYFKHFNYNWETIFIQNLINCIHRFHLNLPYCHHHLHRHLLHLYPLGHHRYHLRVRGHLLFQRISLVLHRLLRVDARPKLPGKQRFVLLYLGNCIHHVCVRDNGKTSDRYVVVLSVATLFSISDANMIAQWYS